MRGQGGGRKILGELERRGLLLDADAALPSVASRIAGGPVRGSWWGHEKGGAIYAALEALDDHPDVAAVKLVNGKLTRVHRRLFPALLAAAGESAPWQTRGLSPAARALLARARESGEVRVDLYAAARALPGKQAADAARELESRLLVLGGSVHTERGAHAKTLEDWPRWARRAGVKGRLSAEEGRRVLEAAAAALAEESGAPARLPWETRARSRRT